MLVFPLVEAVAASDQLRAFIFPDLDVAQVGLELVLIDRRTHLDGLIEAVANFDLLCACDEVIDELAVNAFLHDDAAGRGAALSGGAERAPEPAFDSQFEIGIVEHDHRILAAEFERTVFEALGRRGAHDPADRGRAGERDGADYWMFGERRPDFCAVARYDIDDAFRNAGVGQRADEVES